jgi:hypothetical protein
VSTPSDVVQQLLRRHDPKAARVITLGELEAMEESARAAMPSATPETIQDAILVRALEVVAERELGARETSVPG